MSEAHEGDSSSLVSTSRASDGSFIAISEIGALLAGETHRLIGGVAVVLHQHRLLGLIRYAQRPTPTSAFLHTR